MWLYQRRAWHRSTGGIDEMASKTATSACDGTYLKIGHIRYIQLSGVPDVSSAHFLPIISVSCSSVYKGFETLNCGLLLSIMPFLFFVISGLVALTRVVSEKRADVGSIRRNSDGSFAQFS